MSKRTDQIESIIQHAAATSLREHLDTKAVVTVTGVEVTPDLKHGTVWVSVLGAGEDEMMDQVAAVRREVQADVSSKLKTKFTPRLSFKLDKGGQYAAHINQLFKKL